MDDSNMEMTSTCCTNNNTTGDFLITQEKFEVLLQKNHNLKKKIGILGNVKCDLENEILFLSNGHLKNQSKSESNKDALNCANVKIKQLEKLHEEKRQQKQFLKESYSKLKEEREKKEGVVEPDQEQLNILTTRLENLKILCMEDEDSLKLLQAEKSPCEETIHQLKCEIQADLNELYELKEILSQKTVEFQNLNETLESAREDKQLLNAKLQLLKSSETHAARGNSLFAEIEENRQKVVAQREVLKLKFINLKKLVNQKQFENNKLKMEIVKTRREEKVDDESVLTHYSNTIDSYKKRISELEARVKALQQPDQPPIDVTDENVSHFSWVNGVVENQRKETRALQAELDRRGSNYVLEAHQLFENQKENRSLKGTIRNLQSEIDELRLNMDKIKSANENLDDGISPPATDIAIAFQRKKTVAFKEVQHKMSNTSLLSDKDSDKKNQS